MNWRDLENRYRDRIEALRTLPAHEILKVSEHASLPEIKTAYRALVKTYHPDRSDAFVQATNGEILKIINSAYETLIQIAGGRQ